MDKIKRAAVAVPAIALMSLVGLAGPAAAADGSTQATLDPVNDASASGNAMVDVSGNTITVHMAATGLLPDQPHAAHIHFGADARHECPTVGQDDQDGDGHLTTTEGAPAYGEIVVSLTKTGDTTPKSGLAVNRFDTAPGGKISYERGSIQVSDGVAQAIVDGQATIVVHGVDYNDDGKYDGDKKSDLDPSLPTEATDPAICGVLSASQMSSTPSGGVETGGGATQGVENEALIGAGALALLAGGALAGRRRWAASRTK